MDRQIQMQTLSQELETAAHKLFNEYVEAIKIGRKDELFTLERQCTERRLVEPDGAKRANLYRDEALIDIALAEQTMHAHGNPYFALSENEHARDKLKIAEQLEPQSKANNVLDSMLRTSFYDSTYLPEFQLYYPGGFPIDTSQRQNYHHD